MIFRTLWRTLLALVNAQLDQNAYLKRETICDLEIARAMLKERLR